jgi:hypothetical protein
MPVDLSRPQEGALPTAAERRRWIAVAATFAAGRSSGRRHGLVLVNTASECLYIRSVPALSCGQSDRSPDRSQPFERFLNPPSRKNPFPIALSRNCHAPTELRESRHVADFLSFATKLSMLDVPRASMLQKSVA